MKIGALVILFMVGCGGSTGELGDSGRTVAVPDTADAGALSDVAELPDVADASALLPDVAELPDVELADAAADVACPGHIPCHPSGPPQPADY